MESMRAARSLRAMVFAACAVAELAACDSTEKTGGGGDAGLGPASDADTSNDVNDGRASEPCVPRFDGAPFEAPIPPPYKGAINPLDGGADEGQALYPIWCARCHGLDARGGGPSDPPPADLTAARRPEDYLVWRISEGGHGDPICSQMPAFVNSLTTIERWQLVSYLRQIETDTKDSGTD